jgi:hypothetical protein
MFTSAGCCSSMRNTDTRRCSRGSGSRKALGIEEDTLLRLNTHKYFLPLCRSTYPSSFLALNRLPFLTSCNFPPKQLNKRHEQQRQRRCVSESACEKTSGKGESATRLSSFVLGCPLVHRQQRWLSAGQSYRPERPELVENERS